MSNNLKVLDNVDVDEGICQAKKAGMQIRNGKNDEVLDWQKYDLLTFNTRIGSQRTSCMKAECWCI